MLSCWLDFTLKVLSAMIMENEIFSETSDQPQIFNCWNNSMIISTLIVLFIIKVSKKAIFTTPDQKGFYYIVLCAFWITFSNFPAAYAIKQVAFNSGAKTQGAELTVKSPQSDKIYTCKVYYANSEVSAKPVKLNVYGTSFSVIFWKTLRK